ncbi:MAG: single-stranded-DNA-specific exonuclease RecJ [Alphaproteobacteria bacterium]|nr:single-stranded-DNA-specific exonuclease RecJ [Alphaproteobacteria bacterium]
MIQVENSLNGKKWRLKDYSESLAQKIKLQFELPEIIARIISQRCKDIEETSTYLDPKVKLLLPNPTDFIDMEKGAKRFVSAIEKKEKIAVFGDYDVDGITSSSLLYNYLSAIKHEKSEFHIPEREEDGYGPSKTIFQKFIDNDAQLILTVDCGITANEPIAFAQEKGVDVVVIDHHEPQIILPKAHALIDPKRLDESGENTHFAAVGMVFIFLVMVNKLLKDANWFQENNIDPVNLIQFLDLVALGTVCDMVPLIGANRAFVTSGLKVMHQRHNKGIKALADIGKANVLKEYHLGFVLGPRINAGGRVGKSRTGFELLTATDDFLAEQLAEKLHHFNETRKDIEGAILVQSQDIIDNEKEDLPFILVAERNWHPGVMGIIAGRLKERYGKPTLAAMIDEDGNVNGSGRSIPGVDLGRLIMKAKEKDIITEGGGHMMAVGFSCREEKLPALREFMKEEMNQILGGEPLLQILNLDAVLDAGALSFELADKLSHIEPFGMGNPEPIFMLKNAQLTKVMVFGTGHLKSFFRASNGNSLVVLAFGMAGSEVGKTLLTHVGSKFDLAGYMRINIWQGNKTIQFHLNDAVLS